MRQTVEQRCSKGRVAREGKSYRLKEAQERAARKTKSRSASKKR